ncbi:MAG: hypothetical protein U9R46_09905 [Bacteroidota bacterium]|nr:hypothetical protein [Bacteroidota bacterium]
MPKALIHPKENVKKIHPFRLTYAATQRSIEVMRKRIMQRNKWSEATFYRKLSNDLPLTESEAKTVALVMNIPLADIERFQNGFLK